VSKLSTDILQANDNPAFLFADVNGRSAFVFNSVFQGINSGVAATAFKIEKWNTHFSALTHFISYGELDNTDASGNVLGSFTPLDYVAQISAGRSYLEKVKYGATFKFVGSQYGQYNSFGLAMDLGLLFVDSAKGLSAGLVAKNMGAQIKKYESTSAQDLPFDFQIGITKRLANAPFSFSLTAHHLHSWDINYNDQDFNQENSLPSSNTNGLGNLFRHIVLASTVYLGDKLEIDVGYNHLRRQELVLGAAGNGLSGFSLGAAFITSKIQVRYSRAQYFKNLATNQFGLHIHLKEFSK